MTRKAKLFFVLLGMVLLLLPVGVYAQSDEDVNPESRYVQENDLGQEKESFREDDMKEKGDISDKGNQDSLLGEDLQGVPLGAAPELNKDSGPLMVGAPVTQAVIGSTSIQNLDQNLGSMDVLISGVYAPDGVLGVCISVCGNNMGTKWIGADMIGDGQYLAHLTELGSDHYVITSYLRDFHGTLYTGQTISQSITIPPMKIGRIAVRNIDFETGCYEVVLSEIQAPRGVGSACISLYNPLKGGEWIAAASQGDGTYVASVNPPSEGDYYITGYIRDTKNVLCSGDTILHRVIIPAPEIGKIRVRNVDRATGDYEVEISGVKASGGVSSACISLSTPGKATEWMAAIPEGDGTFVVSVSPEADGDFYITGYVRDSRNTLAASETILHRVIAALPKIGKISVRKTGEDTGDYEVVLSEIDAPRGVSSACISISRSGKATQWIAAKELGDGTYVASVHPSDEGDYSITGYIRDSKNVLISSETILHRVTVPLPEISDIAVENPDYTKKTYDVLITIGSLSNKVKSACISVYSEKRGTTRWLTAAKVSDGVYKVTVENAVDGNYGIVGYIRDLNGVLVTSSKVQYTMSGAPSVGRLELNEIDIDHTSLEVLVKDVKAPRGISGVCVSVSGSSGDTKWYSAEQVAEGVYRAIISVPVGGEMFTLTGYARDITNALGQGKDFHSAVGYRKDDSSKSLGDPSIGNMKIEQFDMENHTIIIRLENVQAYKGINSVCVSASGQDGVTKWYGASEVESGVYRAIVDASDIGEGFGSYRIVGYVRDIEETLGVGQTISTSVHFMSVEEEVDKRIISDCTKIFNQVGYDLYQAYAWCVNNIRYSKTDEIIPSGYTRSTWFAIFGMENQYGMCYHYAASITWMARKLGYTARYMEGSVPLASGGMGPHGWCEVDISETTYVIDPEFAYNTGKNGYLFAYGASGTYRYTDGREVE